MEGAAAREVPTVPEHLTDDDLMIAFERIRSHQEPHIPYFPSIVY